MLQISSLRCLQPQMVSVTWEDGDEADAATIPDCEELDLEISSGLDAFGADRLRYDWTKALMGVHAIFRMGVSWGRKRGQEEGEKAVLQDIKDGKLSIEDIEKMEL
jgi:hypothetical protein